MRQAIRALDPALPLTDVMTMDEMVAKTMARPRIVATLLSIFAGHGACAGGRRRVWRHGLPGRATRAGDGDSNRPWGFAKHTHTSVFVEALALAGTGLCIGVAGAFALTQVLRTLLTRKQQTIRQHSPA